MTLPRHLGKQGDLQTRWASRRSLTFSWYCSARDDASRSGARIERFGGRGERIREDLWSGVQASPGKQRVWEAGNGRAHHGFVSGAKPRGPGRANGQGRGGKVRGEPIRETGEGDASPTSTERSAGVRCSRGVRLRRVETRGGESLSRRGNITNPMTGSPVQYPGRAEERSQGGAKPRRRHAGSVGNRSPKRRRQRRRGTRSPRLPIPWRGDLWNLEAEHRPIDRTRGEGGRPPAQLGKVGGREQSPNLVGTMTTQTRPTQVGIVEHDEAHEGESPESCKAIRSHPVE